MGGQAADSGSLRAEDWAGEMGSRWLASLDRFESMVAPAGDALMARAAFRSGERVLDIGCGAGPTTLAIAKIVGPEGEAVGVDISAELIAAANRRAQAAGACNVRFACADAGAESVEGAPFDRLFSRFGSMFFPDAGAGFANLHKLVKPGGVIDLSVWAPAKENPWLSEMGGLVRARIELPPPAPRAPGGFAFDDPDYMREVLAAGGFRDPEIVAWTGTQYVGGRGATPQQAADFAVEGMGFAGHLAAKGPAVVAEVRAELEALFARNYVEGAGVGFPGKAWLVRAVA